MISARSLALSAMLACMPALACDCKEPIPSSCAAFCADPPDKGGATGGTAAIPLANSEPDSDRDGALDVVDKCPGTTLGVLVSTDGCAPEVYAAPAE